ncbi:malonyl-ACP O-methyltransferase BioC [Bacteroides sp. UBA939]|uniref:malonyl-ACP O-methyltransferase BioC n=1 Tax=Bacteroides sp. UBA939 TaxID=1946092 RepID=UPI0025C2E8D1|nr:malonyl-ACP O-methyltransferase BioC [Bacteroides sp. UBA939]
MDKKLIAERFARARDTYSREARVQQQVAEKMMGLLMKHTALDKFRRIVEFGCGTGSYSRILKHRLKPEYLLLNDLCEEMKECLGDLEIHTGENEIQFLPGDAEEMDFPAGTDLITSCSTLQWFTDPEKFFAHCHSFLADGGYLAFSTFGLENMHQIRTLTGHGLDYFPVETLKTWLAPYFEIIYMEEEIITLPFSTPLEVLRHLKQTGVTGTEKKMWTRGRLQAFNNQYTELFSMDDGNVTLTYHPIYIIVQKKNR